MRDRLYVGTVAKAAADVAKKYGLGLEIDEFCTAENMDEELFKGVDKAVREKLKTANTDKPRKNSLPGVIFHAPFNELFPAAIDKKVRAIAYERYETAYRLAGHYGTNHMVVHSGFVPALYFKEWHLDRSVEFWTKYMSDKPQNFNLYIENVLEEDPYIMAELFARLWEQPGNAEAVGNAEVTGNNKNIKMCLDVGHANYESRIDIQEWIRVTAKYIGHVHLHNNNGDWDYHQALDNGALDMRQILEALKEQCKPNITYTLETLPCLESVVWLEKNGYI